MRSALRLALSLPLLLLAAGCDEVSDTVDAAACRASGYADEGSVRATVDGDTFSGTCVRVEVQQGTLTIVGADNVVSQNNQEVITLTFPSTTVRSYDLGDDVAAASFAARTEDPNDQEDEVYLAISGTLSLDEYSSTSAEGTFSFTARTVGGAEVEVTSGRFDVTF